MESMHLRTWTSDPPQDRPDGVLLESIRHGDSEALETLVARYWTPLVTYAARIVGHWDGAEDMAQEAFIRIWDRREAWRSHGSVQALLYQIVRNASLDERKRVELRVMAARAGIAPSSARPVTPIEHVQASQLESDMEQAVAALAPRRREVFLLARAHGLTNTEIAQVMGIAKQTVANQLCAALAELRDRLRHHLDTAESGAERRYYED